MEDRDHLLLRYKAIKSLYAFSLLTITLGLVTILLRDYFGISGRDLTQTREMLLWSWLIMVVGIPITGLFIKSIKAKIYTKSFLIIVPTISYIFIEKLFFDFSAVFNTSVLYSALILTVVGFYRSAQIFVVLIYLCEIYFLIYQGILPPPLEWGFNSEGDTLFFFNNQAVKQIPNFLVFRFLVPLLLALSIIQALKIFIKLFEKNIISFEGDAGKVIEEASKEPRTGFKWRADLENSFHDLKLTAKNENFDLVFLLHSVENISSIQNIYGYEAADICVRRCAAELATEVAWQPRFFSLGGDTFISVHTLDRNSPEFKEYLKTIGRPKFFQYNDIRISFQISTGAYISKIEEPLSMIIAKADAARISASKDNKEMFKETADVRNFGSSLQDNIYIDVEGSKTINKVQGEYDPQRLKDAVLNDEIEIYGAPVIDVPSRILAGIQVKFVWIDNAGNTVPYETFEKTLSQIQWQDPYFEVLTKKCTEFMTDCRNAFNSIPIFFKINPFYASNILGPTSRLTQTLAALYEEADFQNVILQIPYYLTPTFTESLNPIDREGPRLALDNFGSRESFQALKDHQFSSIALTPQFYKDIYKNPEVQDLAKAIVGFSQNLNIEIIAQGVADKETAKTLEAIGIIKQQGHYWSPELPIGDLKSLHRSLDQLFSYAN